MRWNLAASALGSIYYLAIYMLGFGFSLGVQVMVGQYNGKGHYTGTMAELSFRG